MLELDVLGCADLEEAQKQGDSEDYPEALESLQAIQARGPQTNPVDQSVDLLRVLIDKGDREDSILPKLEGQLEKAVDLLCNRA